MTPAERRTYSRKYNQLLKAIELKYAGRIYAALRKQVSSFTSTLKSQGYQAAIVQTQMSLLNPHLEPVIRSMYIQAGIVNAKKIRNELRLEQQKRFGTNDELINAIIDYLQRYMLDKLVRPVSETTREWVLRKLSEGVREGKGALEVAKEITGSDFLKFQALRIVRTESVRASNVGAIQAAMTSPFVVVKEWIAAHDNRTRHSHRMMDGTFAEMGEAFANGLMQPGDPNAPAEEVICCRCCVAIVPKRDENGRLIRNRQMVAA